VELLALAELWSKEANIDSLQAIPLGERQTLGTLGKYM